MEFSSDFSWEYTLIGGVYRINMYTFQSNSFSGTSIYLIVCSLLWFLVRVFVINYLVYFYSFLYLQPIQKFPSKRLCFGATFELFSQFGLIRLTIKTYLLCFRYYKTYVFKHIYIYISCAVSTNKLRYRQNVSPNISGSFIPKLLYGTNRSL